MRSNLLLKLIAIGMINILLIVPLSLISFKVSDRESYRRDAQASIEQGWASSQTFIAPVLLNTYETEKTVSEYDKATDRYINKTHTSRTQEFHIAETIKINSSVQLEERYRGIYKVPVYTANILMTGSFIAPPKAAKKSELIVSMSDMRGINASQQMTWEGKDYQFKPGSSHPLLNGSMHIALDSLVPGKRYDFTTTIGLRGLDALHFVPIAKQNEVSLKSTWQHPSFVGQYLPSNRSIDESGFNAQWNLSYFSTGIEQKLKECVKNNCTQQLGYGGHSLGVNFQDPIDVYQMTDRSIKYGALLILLTFIAFYLVECMLKRPIHIMQYGLVGVALATFYLLLFSLSEHIHFFLAYLIAACACIGLIGVYLYHILGTIKGTLFYCAGLAALYAMLLAILQSEDYALLMGSLLLFSVVGGMMLITRKMDWYQVSDWSAPKIKKVMTN